MTCPGAQKVGCRVPPPPRAPRPLPLHSQHRAFLQSRGAQPHPAPADRPPNPGPGEQVPVGHPLLAGPRASSYLLGSAGLGGAGGSGSPAASGTELRAAGKKNARRKLCRGKASGGLSTSLAAGGESPPTASPGRVSNHRSPQQRVPGCPGPPGVRSPPQRSPLWSGAGPFRVSSDISRDGIQGGEPRG